MSETQPAETQEPALDCAVEILDMMPLLMGSLRCKMRHDPANTLTIAQFRVLAFLDRRSTASLSQIADFLELGLPTTSKVVDGLVNSKAIDRHADPSDRRRVSLQLSTTGKRELQATREIAESSLAKMLSPLTASERTLLRKAMQSLRPLFSPRSCNEKK